MNEPSIRRRRALDAQRPVAGCASGPRCGRARCVAHAALRAPPERGDLLRGITDFEREFPLGWNGRSYRYDFAFASTRTILETNGRRWHDDPNDYEHDNEKWSVPARHGYRIVLATWNKVAQTPQQLLVELDAARAA